LAVLASPREGVEEGGVFSFSATTSEEAGRSGGPVDRAKEVSCAIVDEEAKESRNPQKKGAWAKQPPRLRVA